MTVLKKTWKFITSMKFAVILLIVLAVACSVGSVITQNQTYSYYSQQYGERGAAVIVALHLDDAFHSWWFIAITSFLCVNLLLCNILRIQSLINRTRKASEYETPDATFSEYPGVTDPEGILRSLRMPDPKKDGGRLVSNTNTAVLWGAWVCHIGVLLIIIGFALGQMTHREYVAYGVPGETLPVGDSGLVMTIDDFRIGLREDDTVEQYTADITVFHENSDDRQSASISVNNPADLHGYRFYQNSTGYAAKISISKSGEPIQENILCAGEFIPVTDLPQLVIYLNAIYPDYYMDPVSGPSTLSGKLVNPAYLYSIYYSGEILGMNVLMPEEVITVEDYEIRFTDPQNYTLIQAKKDSFTWLALIGGIVTMAGLFMAFYLKPRKVQAELEEDGTWTMYNKVYKRDTLFDEKMKNAVGGAGQGGSDAAD
ncbi:MAG: cytochrome c biogenesis protein ResB [Eubacteriaceae bacterium]|nr:cytochrome c biogenesis protein ResB [Eubacteriaceae bacterium]